MTDKTARGIRCGECGRAMRCRLERVTYPQCGLDDVELLNVPVWLCSNGHREVEIPAVAQLHRLLAEHLVEKPARLNGCELRFLRKQLGFSSREFARYIGVSPVSLSRLENGKRMVMRPMDRLVRLFCAQVVAEREGRPLPKNLLPVLDELEQDTLAVGGHRLEHVGALDGPCARPSDHQQEWRGLR